MEKIMNWIGHTNEERNEQKLIDHLNNVSKLAGEFGAKFGMRNVGEIIGKLHDVGKYSNEFQERVHGGMYRVDHSTAGAQLTRKLYSNFSEITDLLISLPIMSHHSGLCDLGSSVDTPDRSTFRARMKRHNIPNYEAYQSEIKTIPPIDVAEIKDALTKLEQPASEKDLYLYLAVLTRLLYSCLVDADFLDTENFMSGQERKCGDSIDEIYKAAKERLHKKGWLKESSLTTLNGRRSFILRTAMEIGKTKDPGYFRLTVPTGGGKTIASLMFALEHAHKNHMDRIIYVVPYTTIIEQNANVFREFAGAWNVLEHHSNFEFEENEYGLMMRLASENWNMPIVVTTSVQFFESFYSSRPSACRKNHNLVNSVFVFDEAQKIPADYLEPCLNMVHELVDYFNCSAVFCTATQPALDDHLQMVKTMVEICPSVQDQFTFFQRTIYENLGNISKENLVDRLKKEERVMCIVNTRKTAQELYGLLKEEVPEETLFHLSTTMHKVDREKTLEMVRSRLKNGQKVILIATSLVEAGVDLDFDTVFRQLAGLDSIIQSGGRTNREGKRNKEDSKTYIFELEGSKVVSSQKTEIENTRSLFKKGIDCNDPNAATVYFHDLYQSKNSLDRKDILKKEKDYQLKTIGKEFKLIEESSDLIVIPNETNEDAIIRIQSKRGTKEDFKMIQKYTVAIPHRKTEQLYDLGKIMPVENITNLFVLADAEGYDENIGLLLNDDEGGNAIFW